jgi:hypothetical protein
MGRHGKHGDGFLASPAAKKFFTAGFDRCIMVYVFVIPGEAQI